MRSFRLRWSGCGSFEARFPGVGFAFDPYFFGEALTAAEPVPGRDRPVTRVSVEVRRGERIHRDVGVLVIRTSSGWLVESVELEKTTGR